MKQLQLFYLSSDHVENRLINEDTILLLNMPYSREIQTRACDSGLPFYTYVTHF